ncbi:GIY-YIG nuclease family protein [Ixodes scapularis]
MKEHQRDVKYSTNATRLKTELVDHAWTTGHTFDFTAVTTLAKEDRWGPRKLLESWFIRGDKTACNKNRGPLLEAYMDLPDK